jgi:hypothetical protein
VIIDVGSEYGHLGLDIPRVGLDIGNFGTKRAQVFKRYVLRIRHIQHTREKSGRNPDDKLWLYFNVT